MEGEVIKFPKVAPDGIPHGAPIKGSAGLRCHVPGGMATVGALASATGGIHAGGFTERD